MYGYFDIYKDFQNVEMSISLNEFTQKIAKIYIKLIVIEKDSKHIYSGNKIDRLHHYEIPSQYNFDYTSKTNNYLGTMNININNIPIIRKEEQEKKFVRALFGIEIEKTYHRINAKESNSQSSSYQNIPISKETNIRILVAPGVNNFKRVDVQPYNYYFSQTSLIQQQPNENYIYNGNKEIKIYSLDKINEKDDKMIIQINSCSGNYETKLSKKIVTYDDNSNDIHYETIGGSQGRKTYIINNLRDKHVYLSVKSAQNENECYYGKLKDSNNNTCSKELSYLLFYYTTSSHKQFADNNIYKLDYSLDSRANFYLRVPKINNVDEKYLEYDLIWTKNETYAKYLESICFLSQIFNNEIEVDNTTVFIEKNIKLNRRNEIYLRRLYLSSQPVYINLLVRNTKNNELISFEPLKAYFSKSSLRIVVILAILIIIFVPICFYYDIIKEKCSEFNNSGFSLSSLFGKKEENIKYSNLSDNYF